MPAAGTTTNANDEPIHITVTPSQASYFAGETFSVTITITNVRSRESSPAPPRSASHSASHKRGAHSVSSAPLARPPTSPTSRTTLPPLAEGRKGNEGQSTSRRRGLIGKRMNDMNGVAEGAGAGKRPNLTKSLSLSIPPHELEAHLREDVKGKSPLRAVWNNESVPTTAPTSPRVSSPLARTAAVPINHPHARKQSVMDGQLQLQDLRPPPTLSPFTPTPNPSTSAFSLSLDPITESVSTPGTITPSHSFSSPIPETTSADFRTTLPDIPPNTGKNGNHAYPPKAPHARQGHRPAQLGLGHPSHTNNLAGPPRTAFSSSFPIPNTELILYSYAQLVGTLSIIPPPGSTPTPDQIRTLQHIRSTLLKRQCIGGGSMDIASFSGPSSKYGTLSPGAPRRAHSRSSSLSGSLFSLMSTSPAISPQPWTPGHRARTPSMLTGLFTPTSPAPPTISASNSQNDEETVDSDTPLPTFEVQPTMLAVDLSLGPGESRSYTYTLPLPETLPPTFRGRSLRFSYQFILGICRAGSTGNPNGAGPSNQSRVMKVPIRVYTNVTVGRPPTPYDLLWPVGLRKRMNLQLTAKVVETPAEAKPLTRSGPLVIPGNGAYLDLQTYARSLFAALPDSGVNGSGRPPIPTLSLSDHRFSEGQSVELGEGTIGGCREAIEMLTRNPKKLSYDVNKDGVKVAVLTFTKVAYRLGETVLGVVELNEPSSRARVLKLSALLEAHESLPGCISSNPNSRHLRRVHAEQHSSFVTSTLRTTFSLDIPPDASPAFQVDVKSDTLQPSGAGAGGLEWKVRLCLLVSVGSAHTRADTEGVRLKNLVRDGPRGEWGSSWKASPNIAPMEWPDARAMLRGPAEPGTTVTPSSSWMSFLTSTLFGSSETPYHDGDEGISDDEDDATGEGQELEVWGSEEDWRGVRVEMVECEVPIKVWPGNTAYKAGDVVFDV
ncbi:Rgp1-domain-containing protein [Cristinia sonorae]|uniref:Rgp1-domain-containing protein n=1 Tax=Cristinia sonorae TaxID=1940300 RepID=A0A8K0UQR9_9AGAR|nr:Rgp1-domain-containing protein [Cristinia sonorae]